MKENELYAIIEYVASYSVFLPLTICIFKIRALNATLWALLVYLACCAINDQIYLAALPSDKLANKILNIWTILECFLILLMFYLETKLRLVKYILTATYSVFLIFAVTILRCDLSIEDNVVSPAEAGLMICTSVSFFILLIFDDEHERPVRYFFFWINLALLLYFCAAILIFITNDYLIYLGKYYPEKARLIWGIHNFVGISCNILISIGICQNKRTQIQS